MEWSKTPILDRFDTIWHIMPYYAHTHKAFLLLSSLCSSTRHKLDEYYIEFINVMKENWIHVDICFDKGCLHLTSDLFIINIWRITRTNFENFLEFINNLKESKGCYFNKNFMHSQIKFNNYIRLNFELIGRLYPYVDILKSIQVRLQSNLSKSISLDTIEIDRA